MVGAINQLCSSSVTISPFPCSACTRHGVDVTRQAAAGYGCMAALEAEKWIETEQT